MPVRSYSRVDHTERNDMAQPAGYKNPLNIPSFWQKASAEPQLEWRKWVAMMEMAMFARGGIEVRNLIRRKTPVVEPTEKKISKSKLAAKQRPKEAIEISTNKRKE